jgi:hypothetical protein
MYRTSLSTICPERIVTLFVVKIFSYFSLELSLKDHTLLDYLINGYGIKIVEKSDDCILPLNNLGDERKDYNTDESDNAYRNESANVQGAHPIVGLLRAYLC